MRVVRQIKDRVLHPAMRKRNALETACDYLAECDGPEEVWFVLFGQAACDILREKYERLEDI